MLYGKVFTYLAITRFAQLGHISFTGTKLGDDSDSYSPTWEWVMLKYISSCSDSIYNLRFIFNNPSPFWKSRGYSGMLLVLRLLATPPCQVLAELVIHLKPPIAFISNHGFFSMLGTAAREMAHFTGAVRYYLKCATLKGRAPSPTPIEHYLPCVV